MTTGKESVKSDLLGRVAVVTGATGGIGFATALGLAERGAEVVLASRNAERTKEATDRIAEQVPGASTEAVRLDLGSLRSVREAAERIATRHARIDLLINNAGVNRTGAPTEDGFETQIGINHLGPFAFTGLLLERMLDVAGSRVVTVSSIVHRSGRLDASDLTSMDDDRKNYARSKLANLLYTHELASRLSATGAKTLALAAHPGIASTDMSRADVPAAMDKFVGTVLGRTPARGAQPTLRAATDPAAGNGEFFGPGGFLGLFGGPGVVRASAASRDSGLRRELWEASERLTGVTYPFPEADQA
jgi:NAD(P)-dependent dehydrogenase (short-subunit alcohol dehydrogenase family)